MIEARELRQGNSILIDGVTPGTIKELRETHAKVLYQGDVNGNIGDRMSPIDYDRIKPIPLTEERLLEFGFKDGQIELIHPDKLLIISATVGGKYYFYLEDTDGSTFSLNYIQYAHQLQNLYFTLTGEELVSK